MTARYLTTAEVAKRLGITPARVRARINVGQLRAVNIALQHGDVRWRVSEVALAEYLAQRERAPRRLRSVPTPTPLHEELLASMRRHPAGKAL